MFVVQGCVSLPISQHENIKEEIYIEPQHIKALKGHLKVLSADNMAGREFNSPESLAAQNYIISSLIKSDVQPFKEQFHHTFKQESLFTVKHGSNVIGLVRGSRFPEQFIVLSAHYDHLGVKGTRVFNGADDNASGTAALLAYGDIIANKPLKYSVIFLFTDGEEVNLLGSKAFLRQQKQMLPQIRLNINIDMIGGSKNTSKLHFIENRLEKILTESSVNHIKQFPSGSAIKLKRGFKDGLYKSKNRISWRNASDHGSFNKKHIPFIYFGVGMHTNYHTTHDTFENINISFYVQSCELIFQYLMFFDENIIPLEFKT